MTPRPESTRTAAAKSPAGALALAYMQRRMETETHDSALAPAFEDLRAYVRWSAERDAAAAAWEVSASRLREKLRDLLARAESAERRVAWLENKREAAEAEVARLRAALEAVVARREGVFDHPALMAFGPLGFTVDDMHAIARAALREGGLK